MSRPSEESILFSSLPKWQAPWSEFFLSYGAQVVIIGILVWIPVLHPEILEPPKKDYHAIELVPTPVPVNHTPQRQLPRPVLGGNSIPFILRPQPYLFQLLRRSRSRKWKTHRPRKSKSTPKNLPRFRSRMRL